MTDDLTAEEAKAIRALRRLEEIWPESLWLYSAGSYGKLCVMKKRDGKQVVSGDDRHRTYSQDGIVAEVDIMNDGGDGFSP
ncbi:MAG: hypothetical protein KJN72_12295 [Woeseia sp.]|nr:hypothetical protein [Woeseia sp.]